MRRENLLPRDEKGDALALWVYGWWPATWEEAIAIAERTGQRVFAAIAGEGPTTEVLYTPATLQTAAEAGGTWS